MDCDTCPGRFLRYTTKDIAPVVRYCSHCGKQMIVVEEPKVLSYDTITGLPRQMKAILACPDRKSEKSGWLRKKEIESEHSVQAVYALPNDGEIVWQ